MLNETKKNIHLSIRKTISLFYQDAFHILHGKKFQSGKSKSDYFEFCD